MDREEERGKASRQESGGDSSASRLPAYLGTQARASTRTSNSGTKAQNHVFLDQIYPSPHSISEANEILTSANVSITITSIIPYHSVIPTSPSQM